MSAKTRKSKYGRNVSRARQTTRHAEAARHPAPGAKTRAARTSGPPVARVLAILAVAVAGLGLIFTLGNRPEKSGGDGSSSGSSLAGQYSYAVGSPIPGEAAPPMVLESTSGGTFDLSSLKGEKVLLFLQEGVGCQACWDNQVDIEENWDQFEAIGITQMVTVVTEPIDILTAKAKDEGLRFPVLSDPGAQVSGAWGGPQNGMHPDQGVNGHSFLVVEENGVIEWRADYGGPPDYNMYIPINNLIADIQAGSEA